MCALPSTLHHLPLPHTLTRLVPGEPAASPPPCAADSPPLQLKARRKAIDSINAEYGKGTVMLLGDHQQLKVR